MNFSLDTRLLITVIDLGPIDFSNLYRSLIQNPLVELAKPILSIVTEMERRFRQML